MGLIAITRGVSPSINNCELTFHERGPIDVANAIAQHKAYENLLAELGCEVISLPAEPDLPDAVFDEDPAVVLDEVAIISNMGAASRRPEARSLAQALAPYRPLEFLVEPATLDGGDVMRIDRRLFVGLSQRTNREAVAQLSDILQPFGYRVRTIEVTRCLHLKSGCSYIGKNSILVNRSFIDAGPLHEFELLDVPDEEPAAANALLIQDVVIIPTCFTTTRALLGRKGFNVRTIDLSELQKAEAGVTCTSIIILNC